MTCQYPCLTSETLPDEFSQQSVFAENSLNVSNKACTHVKHIEETQQKKGSTSITISSACPNGLIDPAIPCHTHQWSRKLISVVHNNKTWTRLLPAILSCLGPSLHFPPARSARAKPRAVLSRAEAIEIFLCKLARATAHPPAPSAAAVARAFDVSEKAVRDIWKGRTWANETAAIASLPVLNCRPHEAAGAPAIPGICPAAEPVGNSSAACGGTPAGGGSGDGSDDGSGALRAGDGGWFFEPAGTACGGGGRECADPFHDDWPHWDPATPPPLVDPPPLPPPDW
jgi:hypothetical protein